MDAVGCGVFLELAFARLIFSPLSQDIEWKITYVGAAEDERYDQVLDTVLVGPVPVGCNKFVFEVCSC